MIIDDLRNAGGRLAKEAELRILRSIEKQMFRYAYDKCMSFGVKFSDHQISKYPLQDPCLADFELLDKLMRRELTGSAARDKVTEHANEYGALVMLICNKDLRCGVTATSVNKLHPGTVPVFKIQLAKELPLDKVEFPCFVETKYDGVRIVITNRNGRVQFITRNGHSVNLPLLKCYLENQAKENYVLDTEVTLESGKMEDRTKVSGMINSAMKGGAINEQYLMFNVFDFLNLADFDSQRCNMPYHKRRVMVVGALAELRCSQLERADAYEAKDRQQAEAIYAMHISQGYEGLILKHADSYYTFKRTTDWAKMKETKTADLECVDFVWGTGKYEGMIGALVCEGTVEGKTVRVQVGSGLSDAQRSADVTDYVGKVLELKYNTVIQDKTTLQHSLFLPRFVMVREDKS